MVNHAHTVALVLLYIISELKAVKKMKKSHKWSNQLLKALMQRPYSAFTGAGGLPGTTDSSVDEDMLRQLSQWKQGTTYSDSQSRVLLFQQKF